MGNCIETCIYQRPQVEEKQQKLENNNEEEEEGGEDNLGGLQKETNKKRIKMVLTKVELEWLMFQLKDDNKEGKIRLEDVLEEIERGRAGSKAVGWKPSLQSIIEIPELHQMDT